MADYWFNPVHFQRGFDVLSECYIYILFHINIVFDLQKNAFFSLVSTQL